VRFLVMVKVPKEPEGRQVPKAAMGAFNQTLIRDGVLLAAEGLQPSSKGARITYSGERPTVTDGPFAESKEVVAGFWLLQGRSKEEIVERLLHCPFEGSEFVEIRQIFEREDFPELQNEGCAAHAVADGERSRRFLSETPNTGA
jgi:hypothetical protein